MVDLEANVEISVQKALTATWMCTIDVVRMVSAERLQREFV